MYVTDKEFEKRTMKWVREILGGEFVRDEQLNFKERTDLVDYGPPEIRVSVRVRRFKAFQTCRKGKDFTIRYVRSSGVETEIHKIRQGLVSYMFYGFANKEVTRIFYYNILDLRVFKDKKTEPKPLRIKWNFSSLDSALAVYMVSNVRVVRSWLREKLLIRKQKK